jgi:hypothetical protein
MTFTKSQLDAMRADAGWLRAGFRANTAIACADHVDELVAEVERLTTERNAYSDALRQIYAMLTIPAAEYVPAIQDVFDLIDATLLC